MCLGVCVCVCRFLSMFVYVTLSYVCVSLWVCGPKVLDIRLNGTWQTDDCHLETSNRQVWGGNTHWATLYFCVYFFYYRHTLYYIKDKQASIPRDVFFFEKMSGRWIFYYNILEIKISVFIKKRLWGQKLNFVGPSDLGVFTGA